MRGSLLAPHSSPLSFVPCLIGNNHASKVMRMVQTPNPMPIPKAILLSTVSPCGGGAGGCEDGCAVVGLGEGLVGLFVGSTGEAVGMGAGGSEDGGAVVHSLPEQASWELVPSSLG